MAKEKKMAKGIRVIVKLVEKGIVRQLNLVVMGLIRIRLKWCIKDIIKVRNELEKLSEISVYGMQDNNNSACGNLSEVMEFIWQDWYRIADEMEALQ